MSHVYTGDIRVRHCELDAFGWATPGSWLRWLAQVAIDASTDAGFDAAWYAAAGGRWLVRRTTFEVLRSVRVETTLAIRTWVEDFRRVRSRRRYEARDAAGSMVLTAATDWVYVDAMTGRLRRVPEEMERRFGMTPEAPGAPRAPWTAPAPPPTPARAPYRVRWAELDSLGHMNNAAYVDLLAETTLDVLAARGWPPERLAAGGLTPVLTTGDIEYLDAARWGEQLEAITWFAPAPRGLTVHQEVCRADGGAAVVRGNAVWSWLDAAGAAQPAPADLGAALEPLRAA